MIKRVFWIVGALSFLAVAVSILFDKPSAGSVPITTTSEAARDLYRRGRDFSERHRPQEALKLFEEAVGLDSTFAMGYLQLARMHPHSERRSFALERALRFAPSASDGEQLQIAAVQARRARNYSAAAEALAELVKAYPNDPRSHNDYGNYLYARKDWAGAIEQYLEAVRLDPTFSEAYNGLGYGFRYQGNLQAAERFFLKYLALIPDDPNPYDSYADLLTELNRHEEAITYYQKALDIDPGFTASHLGIASNYNMLGLFAKARHQLDQFVSAATTPDLRHEGLVAEAISYAFEGDLDQASRRLQVACNVAREMGDSSLLIRDIDRLGRVQIEAAKPDEAARLFVQALQVAESRRPNEVQNSQLNHQQRMALVWLVRGDFESAASCATKYYELVKPLKDPVQLQLAHQTLGIISLAMGRLDSAVSELLQSDLTHSYNQYYLALAFERIGDITQALKYYRHATDYDQFDPLTHAFVRRKASDKVSGMLSLLRDPGPPPRGGPPPGGGPHGSQPPEGGAPPGPLAADPPFGE